MQWKKAKTSRFQSGQVTVEYILLAVALMTLFKIMANTISGSDYLKEFQETPHRIIRNLIENGNWRTTGSASRDHHPNQHSRHFSYEER